MPKTITLGMDTLIKLTEWENEGKYILHLQNRDHHIVHVTIWGEEKIKKLRDFLLEEFPLEEK